MPDGFVYLSAVIDWYSKAILAHKISNTMDESLALDVLNEALALNMADQKYFSTSDQQKQSKPSKRRNHRPSRSFFCTSLVVPRRVVI